MKTHKGGKIDLSGRRTFVEKIITYKISKKCKLKDRP